MFFGTLNINMTLQISNKILFKELFGDTLRLRCSQKSYLVDASIIFIMVSMEYSAFLFMRIDVIN